MPTLQAVRLLAATASGHGAERVKRCSVAGLACLAARADDRAPTLVFANACTPAGLAAPGVACFLAGAARSGSNALAPELPGLREGRITESSVDGLVRVAAACEGPLVLMGASTGGSLAVLAAADPRIASRVTLISAVAPFADLANVLRLATTGYYVDPGFFRPYPVHTHLAWVAARSLRALGSSAATEALLRNRSPECFADLFDALPDEVRAAVAALSPVRAMADVRAPVEVACSPADPFFPPTEARALEAAGARLTVTPALEHVSPRLGPGLWSLLGFLGRTLLPGEALTSRVT